MQASFCSGTHCFLCDGLFPSFNFWGMLCGSNSRSKVLGGKFVDCFLPNDLFDKLSGC